MQKSLLLPDMKKSYKSSVLEKVSLEQRAVIAHKGRLFRKSLLQRPKGSCWKTALQSYTMGKIGRESRKKEELASDMERYDWTNCPKVIKAEVNTLQTEFSRLPGLHLSGIYLHGSLALGGFQPARSDIDMIVTTSEQMDAASERAVIELLLRVSKFPSPVDVYFLLERDIILFRQPLPFMLHYSEQGREDYEQMVRTGAWKQWNEQRQYDTSPAIFLTVLYRKGICLVGKPIEEVFPHVPEQVFRDALVANFQDLQKRRLQDIVSFVLNACRIYAYLHDRALLAKDEGADWGLAHVPEIYHPLIQQALALYRSERLSRPVGRSLLDGFTSYMEEAILRQQAVQA